MRGHVGKREGKRGVSWFYSIYLGIDPNTGKKKHKLKRGFRTKRLAEGAMNAAITELEKGFTADPGKMTLGELLKQWERDYVNVAVRARTAEGYHDIIHNFLIPRLGNMLVSRVTPIVLERYYNALSRGGRLDGKPGGLSPTTLRHHHTLLSRAFRDARRWGITNADPVRDAQPPKESARTGEIVFTPEMVNAILQSSKDTLWHPLVTLAIYSGLRRSELQGLRWMDVDFETNRIYIRETLARSREGNFYFEDTKTSASRSTVALSETPITVLSEHRVRSKEVRELIGYAWSDEIRVFGKEDGGNYHPSSVSHGFKTIARKAGYPDVRFHDLRHAHASLLLAAGQHLKVVQERMRHSTIKVTGDIYMHTSPEMDELAAESFEEILR